jgi:hypothetical protein
VRVYALVEADDPKAIDVYLCEQDAQRALEDCLRDKPDWRGVLRVEEIELAGIVAVRPWLPGSAVSSSGQPAIARGQVVFRS